MWITTVDCIQGAVVQIYSEGRLVIRRAESQHIIILMIDANASLKCIGASQLLHLVCSK